MKNDYVAILDFGSGKITCMAASKLSDNGEFIIKAVGQSAYSGFDDKTFYEPQLLDGAINQAISNVEGKIKSTIREIYVGVPGTFCTLATSEASITFHSKKKIDPDDVQEVVKKADIYKAPDDFLALEGRPAYFMLDGVMKKFDPVGMIANKLTGLVTFSFVRKYFCNCIAPVLSQRGIRRIHYINACDAQAAYIANAMFNEAYTIIIDIGYITTNVALSAGRGVVFQKAFALGSGYLASDLCQVLGCDFKFAMSILEKVNLNLDIQQGDAYSIDGKMIDAAQTNSVLKARINQIADYVIKSFGMYDRRDIPADTSVVLTGGGLAYLRGGVDCLSGFLNKPVKLYSSVNPQTNRNEYTSSYGLIYQAIKENNSNGGFFSFLRRIGKGDK